MKRTALLALFALGCDPVVEDTGSDDSGGQDADTDADADGDTDADTDADADSDADTDADVPVEDVFTVPAAPADLLFVLDNSGSMNDELTNVRNSAAALLGNFGATDFHIGVITMNMSDAAEQGRLRTLPGGERWVDDAGSPPAELSLLFDVGGGSGSEGFSTAMAALSAPLINNENAGFVRPEAHLQVVMVSDDDESGAVLPADFRAFLLSQKTDSSMVAYSLISGDAVTGCATAQPAPRFHEVGDTWGYQSASICDVGDLSSMMNNVGITSTTWVREYALTEAPDESTLEVWYLQSGTRFDVAPAGVFYTPSPPSVYVATFLPIGEELHVRYSVAAP